MTLLDIKPDRFGNRFENGFGRLENRLCFEYTGVRMNNAQRIAQAILDIDTTLGVADMQPIFQRLWDEAETLGVHSEVDAILQAHHLKFMREVMERMEREMEPTREEALPVDE